MGSYFPTYVFHPASFDKDKGALTNGGLAEIKQYTQWATAHGNSRLLVLHSASAEAKTTAEAFLNAITIDDFASSMIDLLKSAQEIAERAQRYTIVVFVEQEKIFPLSDAVSKLIGGEGVPLFSISSSGRKNTILPTAGEGLVVLKTHVATQWRIQGRFNQ